MLNFNGHDIIDIVSRDIMAEYRDSLPKKDDKGNIIKPKTKSKHMNSACDVMKTIRTMLMTDENELYYRVRNGKRLINKMKGAI